MVKFSVNDRLTSFRYAFRGLGYMVRTQHNAWIHIPAALVALCLGFFFRITMQEWIFVITAIGFVFAAELFNTAIESLVDLVSPGWQEKAGRIKDIAAAGVFVAALTALAIGLIIFIPYLLQL
jgi:diacylglycerol kinase (ATP)